MTSGNHVLPSLLFQRGFFAYADDDGDNVAQRQNSYSREGLDTEAAANTQDRRFLPTVLQ
jgi:hypothetical protein